MLPWYSLPNESATTALGARLADAVKAFPASAFAAPLVVWLAGEMGSGKSTLARGFLRAMGVTGRIKSPTYALFEHYSLDFNVNSRLDLYHFDLYRFIESSEWRGAGFSDLLLPGTISLIEWPEKALGQLPAADLSISLTHRQTERSMRLQPVSEVGQSWAARLTLTLASV